MRHAGGGWAMGLALAIAAGCARSSPPYVPGADWERAAEGTFDQAQMDRALARADSLDTTSLLVLHGGRIAGQLGDVTELGYIASARKSVLAMLYGPYVEDGTIALDATLDELGITDVGGLRPVERRATVRDLLGARSGVYHPAANGGDDTEYAPARGSVEPGTYFLYNNWDFNALGGILEKRTGRDIFDLLHTSLAVPLGMQDEDPSKHWKAQDSTRSVFPAYHMVLSTRDMARLGLLMLREGRWGERQLIPAHWIHTITSLVTPRVELHPPALQDGSLGYGYLWWVFDDPTLPEAFRGAYTAEGAFGQFITVIPRLDLVVAHKVHVPPYNQEVTVRQYVGLLKELARAF